MKRKASSCGSAIIYTSAATFHLASLETTTPGFPTIRRGVGAGVGGKKTGGGGEVSAALEALGGGGEAGVGCSAIPSAIQNASDRASATTTGETFMESVVTLSMISATWNEGD